VYASDPPAVGAADGSVVSSSFERTPLDPRFPTLASSETPLRELPRIASNYGGRFRLAVKLEAFHPSGSVKDRAARYIVAEAISRGALGPDRTLIDASSGNTAVAYALLGEELGFDVEVCLPRNVRRERLQRIRRLGARVTFTDPLEGTDGAQREARRRAVANTERYYYPDQYNNPGNPAAHYRSTGPEIWNQTSGGVTHFVAGVGTGGTISGAGRYLKDARPDVRVIGVEPSGPIHGLEGLKHLPTAVLPGVYDAKVVDRTIRVNTEDAIRMQRRVLDEEGLRIGASSAAAMVASVRLGRSLPGSWIVTIAPDAGHGAEGP
jgi:S-sulfo-L-cysteine synthase (O-acetyl-L-serine-dependent)